MAVPALAYEEAAVTVAVESLDDRKSRAGNPPPEGARASALPDRLPMEGFSNGITSALMPILAIEEPVLPGADARSHLLFNQWIDVRFVVDHKNLKGFVPLAIHDSPLPYKATILAMIASAVATSAA